MAPIYLDPGGVLVDTASVTVPRARVLVDALASGRLDFVCLVECRRRDASSAGGGAEIIIVDLDIERPQLTVHDIRHVERVAVLLQVADDTYPEVLALRGDFPSVPHLNVRQEEFPRSLCLYDQSWDEVRSRWTAATFLETIRQWLAETSCGTLHRDDQPLEPLLFGTAYRLVIPAELVTVSEEPTEKLDVVLVPTGENRGTFIAGKSHSSRQGGQPGQFIASMFVADARQHGAIRHSPRNLSELADLVKGETFDLTSELRERLKRWKDDGCLDDALILVIAFPLRRQEGTQVEITDIWAFLTLRSVFEVGTCLGVWDQTLINHKREVALLISRDDSHRGTDVELDVIRPHFSFSRASAAKSSGIEQILSKTVAVGAGALGSQVIMNLVRSGFGTWTVIDDDELMPHNLARHALPPRCVGLPKAAAVGGMIDAYYESKSPTQIVVANILRPGEQKQAIDTALSGADLILDFAASVPVARHLSRCIESSARRVSLFLNPSGSDLVCLSEDSGRTASLDCLELQYYRAVIRDERLSGHLNTNTSRTRYARSCRDVSFSLPTHLVSLHAAIGAHAVRAASSGEDAAIRVWRSDPVTCAVTAIEVPVQRVHRGSLGDWSLIIDDWLVKQLSELRLAKLPNETGGVLIGAYDLPSKTVYVVDTIQSPPDSEEWPTLYIRGSEGLRSNVSEITEMTGRQLEYVGEWHSHPDGCACTPSDDDFNVFSWITDGMSPAGLPALMAIVGENASTLWFLASIEQPGGWEFCSH